jgi:hypothetical protein
MLKMANLPGSRSTIWNMNHATTLPRSVLPKAFIIVLCDATRRGARMGYPLGHHESWGSNHGNNNTGGVPYCWGLPGSGSSWPLTITCQWVLDRRHATWRQTRRSSDPTRDDHFGPITLHVPTFAQQSWLRRRSLIWMYLSLVGRESVAWMTGECKKP